MLLSIVVPVFNEQDNIKNFYQEVTKSMQSLDMDYEIIFVDDGSKDNTAYELHRLTEQDSHVKAVLLARNFGHQLALTCGLDYATGDAIITMDGDMQHPPAMIGDLVAKWKDGYEVVQTVRLSTQDAGMLKRLTSKWYYKVINAISEVTVTEGGSDFRLMDRKVLETFKRFKEHARFIRGIIGDIGYKQTKIEFVAPKRFAGKSKFSLHKMLHFALDGIMAYSKLPLRISFYIGILSGLSSILLIAHILVCKLLDEAVPGWATTMTIISLFGGLQLIGLGIIGEYIGRIFEEVKARPLYWVRAELGMEKDHSTKK